MALDHYSVAISSAVPILIAKAPLHVGENKCKVYIANTGGYDIYLGDATVTSADGYLLVKPVGQTIGYRQEFELFGGEALYGICLSGTNSTAAVIITGA